MRIKTYALTAHTALKTTTCLDGRRNSVTIPGGLTLHSLFQACAWTVWCSYVSSIQRQKDIVRDNWRALSYKTQAFCCRVMLKNIHEAPWGKASHMWWTKQQEHTYSRYKHTVACSKYQVDWVYNVFLKSKNCPWHFVLGNWEGLRNHDIRWNTGRTNKGQWLQVNTQQHWVTNNKNEC